MAKKKNGDGELNRYQALIQDIFFKHWKKGLKEFEFEREEFKRSAEKLKLQIVDNIGDIAYSFRYRNALPPLYYRDSIGRAGMDYRRRR